MDYRIKDLEDDVKTLQTDMRELIRWKDRLDGAEEYKQRHQITNGKKTNDKKIDWEGIFKKTLAAFTAALVVMGTLAYIIQLLLEKS